MTSKSAQKRALPAWGRASLDQRTYRLVCFTLTALLLAYALLSLYATATVTFVDFWGYDRTHYLDAVDRWLATGSPYLPNEVAAPFQYEPETYLHPPTALLAFAVFRWLPWWTWWVAPLAMVAYTIWHWRPQPWAWVVLAFIAGWRDTVVSLVVGNSSMMMAAFVAAGTLWAWPYALVFLKPSLIGLPFLGARSRSWWIATSGLGLASLGFGSLWLQWLAVVIHSPGGVLYSLTSAPFVVAPLIARLGRSGDLADHDRTAATVAVEHASDRASRGIATAENKTRPRR